MPTLRLFCALVPPPVVRSDLAALAGSWPDVRWNPPDNFHLTLRFIGACDAARGDALAAALARVRVEPFVLPVGGVGVFPSRGTAKVLWVGIGRGHTRLHQLRKQVDEALLSVDPGLDVHSFQPHFTLGRLPEAYDPRALAAFLENHRTFEAPPFRVAEFHLLSSELTPGRPPAYRIIRTFPLARE